MINNRIALKIHIEDILGFMFAMLALFRLSPFFIWETYDDGKFERLFGIIQFANLFAVIIVFMSAWVLVKKRRIIACDIGLSIFVLISGFVIIYVSGRHNVMQKIWLNYIVLALYLLVDNDIKLKSFNYFKYIFAISLIPALLWYIIINIIGLSIDYSLISPVNKTKIIYEYTYRHYFGAVQLFGRWDPMIRFRFNGIYDEPGVVGSVAGLLLTTNLLKNKKERFVNILLFIEGMLSLSLAFVLFLIIYIVAQSIMNHNISSVMIIISVAVLYLAFINIKFSNGVVASLQSRLIITSEGLSGNDRTSDLFNSMFAQFNNSSSIIVLLFGNGPNIIATTEGRSLSYKNIIYEYGYVVFFLFVLFIVIYAYKHRKRKEWSNIIVLLLLIFANIYQRAGLFYFPYMLIFIGGMSYLDNRHQELEHNDCLV